MTTQVPRQETSKLLNDNHVSRQSLCSYMHMESIFFAEATIQKQICYDITPTSSSSAGCLEKQSHNRVIDAHLA